MPLLPRPCDPLRNPSRSRSADHRSSSYNKKNSSPEKPRGGGPKLVYEAPVPALPSAVNPGCGPVHAYRYPAVKNAPPTGVLSSSTKITSTEPSPTAGSKDHEPMSCCIMDRIEKKYSESSSQLTGQHLYIVLCFQSAVATILFLVFLCVPVAMISIGALNFSSCKLNDAIPLTLTVAGCAYFLISLLSASLDWNVNNNYCPVIISLLVFVAVGASTAGALVVFREVWPSEKPSDSRYCHPSLYYFSFVMWSTFIVFVPVMLVVSVVVFRRFGRHNVNVVRQS